MKHRTLTCLALATAALLTACGGGDPAGPKSQTTRVQVVGDDQGDAGTYGYKFTVQSTTNPKGYPIFTELVAASLGAPALCNHYTGANGSIAFTTTLGCASYAIGGSRINFQPTLANNLVALPVIGEPINGALPPGSQLNQVLSFLPGLGSLLANAPALPLIGGTIAGITQEVANLLPATTGANSPLSVLKQLETLGTNGVGAQDLVIVIAGTNDASDLATAYIQSDIDQGLAFTTLVGTQGISNSDKVAAGNAYMAKLADQLYASVTANVLAKGGQKVVILNLLNITQAPRLTQARTTIQGAEAKVPAIVEWVNTFNRQLATNIGSDKRIVPIDYRKLVNDAITDKNLLVANSDTAVCPETGKGTLDMLPTYDLKSCTDAMLSANPPAGMGPDWWVRYYFADSAHPTPYLHNLLARGVNLELVRAGLL